MDSFGRLPNDILEHIKFCYDQPIQLESVDDQTLDRLQNKKKQELEEINKEIERRELKLTRIIVKDNQIYIVRNNIYSRRHEIADLFYSTFKTVTIRWDHNNINKIYVLVSDDKERGDLMYIGVQNTFTLHIESYFD